MAEKVVVTGGAGFIGSHLSEALARSGVPVTILDDFSTGKHENVASLASGVEIVEGSILDASLLARVFTGASVVYHQAAVPSVPKSVRDPMTSHEANATGTLQVLLSARDAGVGKVICASSSSYYGDTPVLPKREDMPPNPLSPYALQKYVSERYGQMFHALYGMNVVSLRYFNVFGPRQDPDSEYAAVIPKFIRAIKQGVSPKIYGDGSATRDFSYIDDVVRANINAAAEPGAAGRVINISGGNRITILDLCSKIRSIIGSDIEPVFDAERPGDIAHSAADISLAKEILHWQPEFSLEDGLKLTIPYI